MSPSDLPDGTPGWIVLAAFVIVGLKYLGKFLAEASETWAKILGPLGKRWHERGARRQAERQAENSQRFESIESDLEFYRARARRAERRNEQFLRWYNECDQPFHHDLRIAAAENACGLPDWSPLSEWTRDHHREDSTQ